MIITDKRFISEIEGFEFPNGILNKRLPGCGATEFAIMNDEPTIILSPRLGLIESKCSQHPQLFRVSAGVTVEDIKAFKGNKIISTYDSFFKIKEALELRNYRILCDEMQFIIKDSAFKSNTIRRMIKDLETLPRVTYVSATPLLDIFTQLDYFKNLPYQEIEWTKFTERVTINIKEANSPLLYASKIARAYANGVMKEGTDSIIFFVNSIEGICHIIKKAGLTPDNTNVLIADTDRNKSKISKVGFNRGSLPTRDEDYKPVTICTSAFSAGADFYNKAAQIYVICDVYITKPFSICDEIPQIAGRCRSGNKGLYLIYKAGKGNHITVDEKRKRTELLVNDYNNATPVIKADKISTLKSRPYQSEDDYLFYNEALDKFDEDSFALTADIYSNKIIDSYRYGTVIFNELNKEFDTNKLEKYEEKGESIKRDRGFETALQNYFAGNAFEKESILLQYPHIKDYVDRLSEKQIKALGYQESKIRKFIANNAVDVRLNVLQTFTTDVPARTAKQMLQEIYTNKHITRKAKAKEIVAMFPDKFELRLKRVGNEVVQYLIVK